MAKSPTGKSFGHRVIQRRPASLPSGGSLRMTIVETGGGRTIEASPMTRDEVSKVSQAMRRASDATGTFQPRKPGR